MHHSALSGCPQLDGSRTAVGFRLVELQQFPCMIAMGSRSVEGEVYSISYDNLREIDLLKDNGRLFHRSTIQLASGEDAEAYLMREDQVRGRRRLHVDSWRDRFAPRSGGFH